MNLRLSPPKPASAGLLAHRLVAFTLGLTLLPLGFACGGGGGGGGGGGNPTPPTQPPPPAAAVTYTADSAATGNSLSLNSAVSGTQLTLTLRATSMNSVGGVAFDLLYPAGQLTFVSAAELNDFGGATDTAFEFFQENGRLGVGLARLGTGAGFSGDGDLIEFVFNTNSSGTGRIDFENRNALSSATGVPIANLDWIGGSVRVN